MYIAEVCLEVEIRFYGTLTYPINLQLLLVDADCDALGPVAQHLLVVMVIALQL